MLFLALRPLQSVYHTSLVLSTPFSRPPLLSVLPVSGLYSPQPVISRLVLVAKNALSAPLVTLTDAIRESLTALTLSLNVPVSYTHLTLPTKA